MSTTPHDAVPRYATLPDLPSELLLEAFLLCDNATLVNIGLTCHALHSISLHTFFKRNGIQDPSKGYLCIFQSPPETLPAIYKALFIRNLWLVNFYFNPDINRLFEEVYTMHAMFARFTCAKIVNLHFSSVDWWLARENFGVYGTLDSGKWGRALMGLVNEVVKKGCTELRVNGGLEFAKLYKNLKPGNVCPVGTVQTRSQALSKKLVPEVIPTRLGEFCVHSNMLLQHPFLPWTLSTINASSTLSTLSFRTERIPAKTWSTVLPSLTLPSLKKFEIFGGSLDNPPSSAGSLDLLNFLTRHRKIETLVLYGVIHPAPSLRLREPILPCLTTLIAHPCYISLIISGVELDPEALPILQSVAISSEYSMRTNFNYGLFDDAIRSVGKLERRVTLDLRFASQPGFEGWFSRYCSPNMSPDDNPLASLMHITTLILTFRYFAQSPSSLLYQLPVWLSSLPSLEKVKFVDYLKTTKEIGLEKILARSSICESGVLRWFVDPEGREVDLAEVRKGLEAKGELNPLEV